MQLIWPLLGYLLGSIPVAVLVSRCFVLNDPREVGSGNPGATNVLRSGHKTAAALTLLGDVLKGWIPVTLAAGAEPNIIALTGLAAFGGHLYPLFLGFKGGKGVATAIGVFLGFNFYLGVVFIVTWLITVIVTRYSSLSALIATSVTAFSGLLIFSSQFQLPVAGAVLLMVAFIFRRHGDNITRLREGQEKKIGRPSG